MNCYRPVGDAHERWTKMSALIPRELYLSATQSTSLLIWCSVFKPITKPALTVILTVIPNCKRTTSSFRLPLVQPLWLDAALANKLLLCASVSSVALEVWSLRLLLRTEQLLIAYHVYVLIKSKAFNVGLLLQWTFLRSNFRHHIYF